MSQEGSGDPSGSSTGADNSSSVVCEGCGEEFPYHASLLEHMRDECPDELTKCISCGEGFVSPKGMKLHHARIHGESIAGELKRCENCGKKYRAKKSHGMRFCSKDCSAEARSEFQRGEDNPYWKGGDYSQYSDKRWQQKADQIRERDDYRCQACGVKQDKLDRQLDVHHIKPLRKFDTREEANKEDNLISLCLPCHRKYEGLPVIPRFI